MIRTYSKNFGWLAGAAGLATISLIAVNIGPVQELLKSTRFSPATDREAAITALDEKGEASVSKMNKASDELAGIVRAKDVPTGVGNQQIASAQPPAPAAPSISELQETEQSYSGHWTTRARGGDPLKNDGRQPTSIPLSRVPQGQQATAPPIEPVQPIYQDQGRDQFAKIKPNPQKLVSESPVSTVSIDVDTASYSFLRSTLNRGLLPQKDAIRVEELVNYFDYSYAGPDRAETPFTADLSILPTPWNADTKLLRIGLKGYELRQRERPHANLVFLIDTSGSMNAPDKLPLLRNALRLLVSSMSDTDTVGIVTYAGQAGTVLEPTPISEAGKILSALDQLDSGGSTAGAEGIRQAYQLAESAFDEDGVNRIILATDGDFNVGITDPDALQSFIERKRASGISLSVLGFGHGNYNDAMMQTLAQNGNGNAAYIDTLNEARKVLVDEASSTLFTIAKDVKVQLEFNPATVREYRLIGYESRLLGRDDFNNDRVDAGEIGSGHSATFLYELVPTGSGHGLVDDLRYQDGPKTATATFGNEYGFLKIRYKKPDSERSELIEIPVTKASEVASIGEASDDARFAAAVAAFGEILRGGQFTNAFTLDDVAELARSGRGEDPFGYRAELLGLIGLAQSASDLETLKP